MIGYFVGLLGMWVLADGVASLWAYTDGERAKNQTFWRDHFLRIIRCLVGIALMILGGMLL